MSDDRNTPWTYGEGSADYYKRIFDENREDYTLPQRDILHIRRCEGVRVDLTVERLYTETNYSMDTFENGITHITIRTDEGWKCIPGRTLVTLPSQAGKAEIYRILDSMTYCGYEDALRKEDVLFSIESLKQINAPDIGVVPERILVDLRNTPLFFSVVTEDADYLAAVDVLAKLGVLDSLVSLAINKNINFSKEMLNFIKEISFELNNPTKWGKLIEEATPYELFDLGFKFFREPQNWRLCWWEVTYKDRRKEEKVHDTVDLVKVAEGFDPHHEER